MLLGHRAVSHSQNAELYTDLSDKPNEAVISVVTFVRTWDSLKARIFRDSEGEAILGPQLLEFSKHTIGDARRA